MRLEEQIRKSLREFLHEIQRKKSDDEIRSTLKKYDTLNDLITQNKSLYYIIKKRGDDYFKEVTKDLKRGGLSKDDIRNIARKYENLSDFIENEPTSYNKSRKFGKDFFQEVTNHMSRKRKPSFTYQRRLSDDEIWKLAKKYSTISDFRKNHPKEYSDAINIGRDFMKKITSHMDVPYRTKLMSQGEIINIIKKYDTLKDFEENEKEAYKDFRKYGKDFRAEVTSHFVSPNKKTFSPDELIQIASQYDNEQDFLRGDKEAYKSAIKLGRKFFDGITNHMRYPESVDLSVISKALREWKTKYRK